MSPLRACTVLLVLVVVATACNGDRRLTHIAIDPTMDVFDPPRDGTGILNREFTCLSEIDGKCVKRQCKEGPGGQEFDCTSYAAACVKAGWHWSGTSEGGTCSKVL